MKVLPSIIISLLLAVMTGAVSPTGAAQPRESPEKAQPGKVETGEGQSAKKKINKTGDLASNLELLNQWVKQPESVQRLYASAYRVLAAKAGATFMDVGNDLGIRQLCRETGIVHLGGPMLGSVTENSIRVWLRTLQPAAVEVGVTIKGIEKRFGPVQSTPATDLAAVVPIAGLQPGTSYPYRVFVDGEAISISEHAAITTAPITSSATASPRGGIWWRPVPCMQLGTTTTILTTTRPESRRASPCRTRSRCGASFVEHGTILLMASVKIVAVCSCAHESGPAT